MVAGVTAVVESANRDAATSVASPARVCVALFNERRGRVIIVNAGVIEDAREFAVQTPGLMPGSDVATAEQARLRRACIRERAALTAKLVAELYACRPFGCLLVGGMPGMTPDWLSQYLPGDVRAVKSGVLKLPVGVGENLIAAAALGAWSVGGVNAGTSSATSLKMPYQRCALDGTGSLDETDVTVRQAGGRSALPLGDPEAC